MKLKSLLGGHPALFGGLAVAGLIGVSVAGVAIAQGRGSDSLEKTPQAASAEHPSATTTSSTTTTSTTTTTTTTEPPPPEPEPAPAPAPAAAPSPGSGPAPAPAPEPEPAPEPPPAPPEPGPPGLGGQILAAMNADRAANGMGPLGWHGGLAGYAQNWANWMAQNGSLTHQYLSPMFSLGLNTLGENILVGPNGMSAVSMEQAWMNSPGHRTNILNPQFTVAGVGVAISSDGRIWVAVDFGG